MNRARLLVYATMVGWGLLAPQPAQAQLGSLIVTVTSPADGPGDRATVTQGTLLSGNVELLIGNLSSTPPAGFTCGAP